MPWLMPPADSSQLLVPNPDFSFELLGSDLNELWGDWSAGDFAWASDAGKHEIVWLLPQHVYKYIPSISEGYER
jgi:hypothetical protein